MPNLNFLLLLIIFNFSILFSFTPSSIEKTVFNNQDPLDPDFSNTGRTYFDGLGREIRTVTDEGQGDIVSSIKYDDAGRVIRNIKPYYSVAHLHGWKLNTTFEDLLAQANSYYDNSTDSRPSAGNVAYSQSDYYSDPLNRGKASASPGYNFRMAGGHVKKWWYIGTNSQNFIPNPTDGLLDATSNSDNAMYTLDITKDEDNRYIQTLKDNFGRTLKTMTDPTSQSGDELVTQNFYDIEGRLLKTFLPGPGGLPDQNMVITRKYSTDGYLVEESYPDEGVTKYVYDSAGKLRMKMDSKENGFDNFISVITYYKYDENGRKIEEGTAVIPVIFFNSLFTQVNANNQDFPGSSDIFAITTVKKRWYYDDLNGFDPSIQIPKDVPVGYDPNGRGKLVATVAYNNDLASINSSVLKFYTYDNEGRVKIKSIAIPGVPLQQFEFVYDLQSRLIIKYHYRYEPAGKQIRGTDYFYDKKGRLTKVVTDGAKDITYAYESNGVLKNKNIGGLITENRKYHIRDLVQERTVNTIDDIYTPIYDEYVNYEVGPNGEVGQFSGNLSKAQHLFKFGSSFSNIIQSYSYDGANRLISTTGTPEYQESFAFDPRGRLNSKTENGTILGPYGFEPNTNRIINRNSGNQPNSLNDYVYDKHGNLVYDRTKLMAIFYDYNNMPYRFRTYKTTPPESDLLTFTNIQMDVDMLYDADGQRVLKRSILY